jgi:flavin reductase (DIM6/NTAB) family NADH-FMN oxidoreductase RutF
MATVVSPEHDAFRRLMSHWASGVALVTALGEDGPAGCTVSAVTSVSLDPPRLLVCLDHGSRTLAAIRFSGAFGLNVLRSDQEELSRAFATRAPETEKFAAVGHREVAGTVLLTERLAGVVCRLDEEVPAGDHTILLGAPVHVEAPEDGSDPLLFFRRAYGRLQ